MKKGGFILFLGALFALFLAAGLVTTALAAPAAPIDITLTQPDGSTFIARQWGDEWSNGFETLEGYTIIQESTNWWVYAQTSPEEILIPVLQGAESLRVGMPIPQNLPLHVRPAISDDSHPLSRQSFIQTPNTGTQPVLVLLASFSNRSGTYTATDFAGSMFGPSNSVKDYYLDASFNQLTLAAATESYGTANDGIVGWLNLGYAHPNTGSATDSRNQNITKNALIAADAYINYATYDTNGDGYISNNELHIVVIVAGFERSYNTSTPNVWGHRWNLNNVTPPTLDGKVLGDYFHNGGYAQFGEIHGDHQATIGIMVHELGHDLTWPDLYDTDGTSEGVGKWSIMGAGSWNYTGTNYQGSTPSFPDAWLKWYQGWITPTVVNGTLTGASIPQAETNAVAFLLRPNPGGVDWNFYQSSGTGEYFLVENRQLTGYDAGLPGCGLNIWHIDESVVNTNSANANETRPLVKMMEADGLDDLVTKADRGDAGDPFPGSTTNRTFNYSSAPNSRLYSGADSLVAVTSISNCGATMTANLTYSGVTLNHYNFLPLVIKPVSTPGAFNKISPSNGATGQGASPTLTWGMSSGATRYDYCYDITNDNACSGWTSNGTSTSKALSGLSIGTTYYWHVRATNTAGTTYSNGSSTTFWSFTSNTVSDPILNGDFEAGTVDWVEYSSNSWVLINGSPPVTPHSGSWVAWMGDDTNEISRISQNVMIPVGRSVLHFWYWISSSHACGSDYFNIYINSTQLVHWNMCTSTNMVGWAEGTLNLVAYEGTTVNIKFEATTSATTYSALYLDDISMEVTTRTGESFFVEEVDSNAIRLRR